MIVWLPQSRRWINLAAISTATDLGNAVVVHLVDGGAADLSGADADELRSRLHALAGAFQLVEPETADGLIEPPAPEVTDFGSGEVVG